MEYRRLGKSGLQLSEFSLGSWLTFGKQIDDGTAEELMKYAFDQGVNFFDNAEIYSRGRSEKVMGDILKKMGFPRDEYVVSSKVFWGGEKPNQKGLNRKHVIEACEAALKRLGVDYLDLYYCHRPDIHTPIAETVWTMHNLITQGKILYWGTSEWSADEIREAIGVAERYNLIGPTMEQPQYNMVHRRRFEVEYFKLFRDYGLGSTIWSPLASGVLTGKYNHSIPENTRLTMDGLEWLKNRSLTDENLRIARELEPVADSLGITLAQLSLLWCLQNPNVSTVILGASNIDQLKENMKALDFKQVITDEILVKIEDVLQNKKELPVF